MKWIPSSKALVAISVASSLIGFLLILHGERLAYRIDPPLTTEQQLDFINFQLELKCWFVKWFPPPSGRFSISGQPKPDIALPAFRAATPAIFILGVVAGAIALVRRRFVAVAFAGVMINAFGIVVFFQGGLQ